MLKSIFFGIVLVFTLFLLGQLSCEAMDWSFTSVDTNSWKFVPDEPSEQPAVESEKSCPDGTCPNVEIKESDSLEDTPPERPRRLFRWRR